MADDYLRSRGYLPHRDRPGLVQFVTFRLADSMPTDVLRRWELELGRGPEVEARQTLQRRVQRYLDEGQGNCYLRQPAVAQTVQDCLLYYADVAYDLRAWVIMPNHVHAILRVRPAHTLSQTMHRLKGYSAYAANRVLDRRGTFWARDYYDRYARDDDHLERAIAYVRANPVRAKLCERPEDWPWLGLRDWPGGDDVTLPPSFRRPG